MGANDISTYERGVSFNTFDNPDAADFSLTLNYKHKGYQCTRRSRTFLCGIDQNDYSDFALEWLIDELVDDGDEIVCLRAVEKDSTIANDTGIETGIYRKEAEKLFRQVIHKNSQDEKAISLVLELAVGKVQDIIQRMVCFFPMTADYLPMANSLNRFEYMSLHFWSLERAVETSAVCRVCCLGLFPNTASNNHRSPSLSSVRQPSARKRRRSGWRTPRDAATTISSR